MYWMGCSLAYMWWWLPLSDLLLTLKTVFGFSLEVPDILLPHRPLTLHYYYLYCVCFALKCFYHVNVIAVVDFHLWRKCMISLLCGHAPVYLGDISSWKLNWEDPSAEDTQASGSVERGSQAWARRHTSHCTFANWGFLDFCSSEGLWG